MSVKPLVLWVARQGWTVRFTRRGPHDAAGEMTTPTGTLPFRFERETRRICLPGRTISVDPYGWETDPQGRTIFRSQAHPDETDQDHG